MTIAAIRFRRMGDEYRSDCGRFTAWSRNSHGATLDRRYARSAVLSTAAAKTWYLHDTITGLTHDCATLIEAKSAASDIVTNSAW